ncbi:MAG: hypothetical protein GTN53_22950 [Candidatus Aminicenantes bacterium]|nr:hypothetical protein [Candidatus Aminicenantes bacterium]NIQ69362.1 hypothetical protein [Candidatus Aminicenantes bacterium]NIT25363.1 hypothetical protein [Candidatus Aminicenantes bacterium]
MKPLIVLIEFLIYFAACYFSWNGNYRVVAIILFYFFIRIHYNAWRVRKLDDLVDLILDEHNRFIKSMLKTGKEAKGGKEQKTWK